MPQKIATEQSSLFIADHLVLDMLNTVSKLNGELWDYWQTDAEVVQWLNQAGFHIDGDATQQWQTGALLASASQLREEVRRLVQNKKANENADFQALNALLRDSKSWLVLGNDANQHTHLNRHFAADTPNQLLAPLTELSAAFLANTDFKDVKMCEGVDCVLRFLDKTKARKRRWCSMAVCGNRHKVSKFRSKDKNI